MLQKLHNAIRKTEKMLTQYRPVRKLPIEETCIQRQDFNRDILPKRKLA